MRHTFINILFLFFIGCVSESQQQNKVTREVDTLKKIGTSDSVSKAVFIMHPEGDSSGSLFKDTLVNGIQFDDCHTIIKLFGESIQLIPDDIDLPRIQVVNASRNQVLTMFMFNGNVSCAFSQYQVEYRTTEIKMFPNQYSLNVDMFRSGRGIQLGIKEQDFLRKLGEPTSHSNVEDVKILTYQIFNDLYFADYYFKKGVLVKFRYGNEYP